MALLIFAKREKYSKWNDAKIQEILFSWKFSLESDIFCEKKY